MKMDEFNVGRCGIKIKVIMALAKFTNLIFQITSRWLLHIADCTKSCSNAFNL